MQPLLNVELRQQILREIAHDWGISSREYVVCVKIFNYFLTRDRMIRNLESAISFKVSPSELQKNVQEYDADLEMLRAIQYLSSDLQVISVNFWLQENECHVPLTFDDVSNTHNSGYLQHPTTGERIQDYKSSIVMLVSPGISIFKIIYCQFLQN